MKVISVFSIALVGMVTSSFGAGPSSSNQSSANSALSVPRLQIAPNDDLRLYPTNFAGRLIVHIPATLAETPEAVNGMTMTALSLASMAVDPDLLQEAWVSYDAKNTQWKATWQKPRMFHFGMILLPSLIHKVNVGQKIAFESNGQTSYLLKDDKGTLLVQHGATSEPLSASDLRDMLRARINADGMTLFLDPSGNLVLEASGSRAVALANLKQAK